MLEINLLAKHIGKLKIDIYKMKRIHTDIELNLQLGVSLNLDMLPNGIHYYITEYAQRQPNNNIRLGYIKFCIKDNYNIFISYPVYKLFYKYTFSWRQYQLNMNMFLANRKTLEDVFNMASDEIKKEILYYQYILECNSYNQVLEYIGEK